MRLDRPHPLQNGTWFTNFYLWKNFVDKNKLLKLNISMSLIQGYNENHFILFSKAKKESRDADVF